MFNSAVALFNAFMPFQTFKSRYICMRRRGVPPVNYLLIIK